MSFAIALMLTAAKPAPAYFVNQSLLIGYRSDGKWQATSSLPSKKVNLKFHKVGIGKILGTLTATGLSHVTNGPEGVYLDGLSEDYQGVEFSGPVSVPRRVSLLSNNRPEYVKEITSFLKAHGVKGKARLTKVITADFAGDGKTETLIEASSRDDLIRGGMSAGLDGDYSLVLLRYSHNGQIVTQPLEFDHPKAGEMPYVNKVIAVADFEGKGKMQIAVTNDYYEGTATSLWSFSGGKLMKLIENGVGA